MLLGASHQEALFIFQQDSSRFAVYAAISSYLNASCLPVHTHGKSVPFSQKSKLGLNADH
jgi:hypothetical protein